MLDSDHEPVAAPKFNIVAVYKLLGPNDSVGIILGCEASRRNEMVVIVKRIGAVFDHLGEANPGDDSQSFI